MKQRNMAVAHRDYQDSRLRHRVFLSHSGAQKDFVEQLCVDLERCGRSPFFDKRRDSLPLGEYFPNSIFQAIQECKVGVVILSKDFFTRTKWPMLELAALVESKRQRPYQKLIPVFLGITRQECRDEENCKQWSSVWRNWAKFDGSINVEEWETAVKLFGPINGLMCDGLREVKCREEIVEEICKVVAPESRWDDSQMQARLRFCKLVRDKIEKTQASPNYQVRLVGLYGVGGIGKTTLCKALCNDFLGEFYGKVCHIQMEGGNELELLREMLTSFTNTSHNLLGGFNVDQCRLRLKEDMRKQRIFLVIDNVSNSLESIEQAKTFLQLGYACGSVVIVTCRALEQLEKLNIRRNDCLEMPELEEGEARSMFLHYVGPVPIKPDNEENEKLIYRCLERCRFKKGDGRNFHYHPLALKVLGVQLGSNLEQWLLQLDCVDTFNQFREREHPIFSMMRKTLDTLLLEDQLLFMDAALFYPEPVHPYTEKNWIDIFEWLSMVHGIGVVAVKIRLKNLKTKSVIEAFGDGTTRVSMHDLWREFCVMEAKAGKLECRRWVYVDQKRYEEFPFSWRLSGSKDLHSICLHASPFERMEGVNVSNCTNLKVLKLEYFKWEVQVLDLRGLKHLKSLEILSALWCRLPAVKVLGLGSLRNLLVLRMKGFPSRSLWIEEIGRLSTIQVLDLYSDEYNENKLPNLGRLRSLRKARLSFHSGIFADTLSLSSWMTNLQHLDLGWCCELHRCDGVDELVALQELLLCNCKKLQELPNLQKLQNLQKLDISKCESIKALPGFGDLIALQELRANGAVKLAELPDMRKLTNLQFLYLSNSRCWGLNAVPGLGNLFSLRTLSWSDFESCGRHKVHQLTKLQGVIIHGWIPHGILGMGNWTTLETLTITRSHAVDDLVGLLNLTRLQRLRVFDCGFRLMSGLSNLVALKTLAIKYCDKLERLPDLRHLTGILTSIEILRCRRLSTQDKAFVPLSEICNLEGWTHNLQSCQAYEVDDYLLCYEN